MLTFRERRSIIFDIEAPKGVLKMPKFMNTFLQYLKDTRTELRHVAWPTQTQTIVYTAFVALISIVTALYLGLFDYLFTSGLGAVIQGMSVSPIDVTQTPIDIATSTASTTIPVNFNL